MHKELEIPDLHLSLPFPESYWVVPGSFIAGEYPGGYDELQTRHRLQALLRLGVTRFVDLTHPDDFMPKYWDLLRDEANGYLKHVRYVNYPIQDRVVTSTKQMSRILEEIDVFLAEQEPIYLHCIAGIGRTGTVVGCYLVRHGLAGDQALRQLQQLRARVPSHWARSPEADEQVDFVRKWQPKP